MSDSRKPINEKQRANSKAVLEPLIHEIIPPIEKKKKQRANSEAVLEPLIDGIIPPIEKKTEPPTEKKTQPRAEKKTQPPAEKSTAQQPTVKKTESPTEKGTAQPPTEKETEPPTEKGTAQPPTEKETQPLTEKGTALPPTEKETEPPTEKGTAQPPIEQKTQEGESSRNLTPRPGGFIKKLVAAEDEDKCDSDEDIDDTVIKDPAPYFGPLSYPVNDIEDSEICGWSPELRRVVSVVVSTVMILAHGKSSCPPENLQWTYDFLMNVKDPLDQTPPNTRWLLNYIRKIKKENKSSAKGSQ